MKQEIIKCDNCGKIIKKYPIGLIYNDITFDLCSKQCTRIMLMSR